nr:MAG TPA: hypothetical protein [Caudoviricetes sp.]
MITLSKQGALMNNQCLFLFVKKLKKFTVKY